MAAVLTYGTVNIDSSELLTLSMSQNFDIHELPTVNSQTITNPGNLSPRIIRATAKISNNAATKYTTWSNLIISRPLELLAMTTRTLGLYYLSSWSIEATELANDGDFLRFEMTLEFTSYFNFSS